ncbi:MAG: peptidylprolyl isomerase [Pirellulaceae bacterium]|nr:peptidylprolyl isomerase [Pirellulaceae bacterium]MDP6554443.1 peptidylprolyl isomerase [Pirellulaceae bacterium]
MDYARRIVIICLAVFSSTAPIVAQLSAQDLDATNAPPARVIAATVRDVPVYADEVDRELRRVFKGRQADAGALKFLQAKTLQQLIDRQLILAWLAEKRQAATDQDVQLAQTQLEKRLATREMTLTGYVERLGMHADDLPRALRWQLSWQRFLDRYLSEENLQNYFTKHHIEFDGTQVRVAHLLLKADGNDPAALSDALVRAKDLQRAISSKEIAFADAARQHSQAPSGENGGDIGYISRREPMPEPFSSQAFALKKGELSDPVISHVGVHLILCLEIKLGQKQWTDVRAALQRGVTGYLFTWAADRKRADISVKFTGETPYFQPGTEIVVQ